MALLSGIVAAINLGLELSIKISKHVMYPFKVHKNIRSLDTQTKRLVAMKNSVNTTIENERREYSRTSDEIDEWLKDVTNVEKEAADIFQKGQQLGRCLWHISPNPWSYYKVSRSAAEKKKGVEELCKRRADIKDVIIQMAPPLKQEMQASSSRSRYLDSALADIKTDAHRIIGIWGMGGIGKTHLLEQVNNELSREGAFDVVVFVTCSKECTVEKIQDKIINKLGLSKDSNTDQNRNTIYKFLDKRNFILLMDDLWSRVDLEMIGIPDPMDIVGTCKRKVVLTARSKEVCHQMDANRDIKVDVLKWDDAWSIFKKKVTEETINSNPLIRSYAVDVAKKLGGLPLALITIGRAMHDKKDPRDWELATERLKQAQLDHAESIFQTLKYSFDNLRNETLKQCFLHCSLWPEDSKIENSDLIQIWMGLGLIDEPNIHTSYNCGYSYIRRLQDACLLETIDDYDAVKMHDVIHDMALWIANNNGLEKNKWIVYAETSKNLTGINIPTETEKLSVMHNANVSFSCTSPSPKLSTLLLNFSRLSVFQWIEKFLGLIYIDLSGNNLRDFPIVICKLVHLQFLNLSKTGIYSLPEELAALISLRYLIIRNNPMWNMYDGFLSSLEALRVLDISGCYLNQSMELVPSLLEKTKRLADFQALGIVLRDARQFHLLEDFCVPIRWLDVDVCSTEPLVTFLLGNSHMQNLFSLTISVGQGVEYVVFERTNRSSCNFERLEQLNFFMQTRNGSKVKEIRWDNLNPSVVLKRLRILNFWRCASMTSISWIVYLPCLQELKVHENLILEQLIDEEYMVKDGEDASNCTFPSLKRLELSLLPEMEIICDPKITFPALETIEIYECDSFRELPFRVNTIPPRLRQIIGDTSWWDNIEWADGNLKFSLQPFLRRRYSDFEEILKVHGFLGEGTHAAPALAV